MACLALAMARPQEVAGRTRVAGQGVALVVALDRSPSMAAVEADATEGELSRFERAKRTVDRFIARRPDDLIGLVSFANFPDLNAPPTLDHETLRGSVAALGLARPVEAGTNIGDALAWSAEALRPTSPTRKVIILVTDGANEPAVPDPLDPVEAARLARAIGQTIHTIAIGQAGGLARSDERITGLTIAGMVDGPDLQLLSRVAEAGGGRSFHAERPEDLDAIFQEIDRLEKSPVAGVVWTRYHEWYTPWLIGALALLGLDLALSGTRMSRLP
jgi:Ca-activated chloride channel family protein